MFKLLALLLIFSSCGSYRNFIYIPNKVDFSNHLTFKDKTVAVLPFVDHRTSINSNKMMLYLIPLMPFGTIKTSAGLVPDYLAKALAIELDESKQFKDAEFSLSKNGYDYYIKGTIISTEYNIKILSYGLSAIGPLLWVFGAPATYTTNNLECKLELIDVQTRNVLFSKLYKATEHSQFTWLYSMNSGVVNYITMLQEIYKNFGDDINKLP